MNEARDRIDNDFAPVFPSKDIVCSTCVYRKAGVFGARNGYCKQYVNGKPDEILFDGAECPVYEKDNG